MSLWFSINSSKYVSFLDNINPDKISVPTSQMAFEFWPHIWHWAAWWFSAILKTGDLGLVENFVVYTKIFLEGIEPHKNVKQNFLWTQNFYGTLLLGLDYDCYFVKMTWYCLNPKLFLNFCAALLLQSMITLAANFLSIRFLWDCLFVPLLDHIYVLHSVNHILLFFLANFYYVIFLLYVFHLTPIFFHYLLLFLRHFFHKLSTLST